MRRLTEVNKVALSGTLRWRGLLNLRFGLLGVWDRLLGLRDCLLRLCLLGRGL